MDLSALGWLMRQRPQGLGDLGQIDPVTGQPAADAQMGNAVAAPPLGALLKGAWNTVDYPRQVLQGEVSAMDPRTGHVSDQSTLWALGQAVGRLPPRYSRPMMMRQSQQQQYGT